MRVAELSDEPLIANRISGNSIGKMTRPRWRMVRTSERRAIARICSVRLVPITSGCDEWARLKSTATSPPAAPALWLDGIAVAGRVCVEVTGVA
jgi:hypothetical protein